MIEDKRRTAIFLDMDDTIIRTRSKETFAKDVSDWEFIPGVLEKMLEANKNFDFLFIISNQGGIEQGYHTYTEIKGKFAGIKATIQKAGVRVDDIHFSPYSSYHYDRKPNPGFAYAMARKYQLDLQKCLMVGDGSDETCWTTSDRDFASNAGMQYMDIKEFLKN
jgi:D-glycero-D-manno-heptose 1,7-bisphosphate phosphatase